MADTEPNYTPALDAFVRLLESISDPHEKALGSILKNNLNLPLLRKYRGDKITGVHEAWFEYLTEIHKHIPSAIKRDFVCTNPQIAKDAIIAAYGNKLLDKWPPKREYSKLKKQGHLRIAYAAYFWAHAQMGQDFTLATQEIDRIFLGASFEQVFGGPVLTDPMQATELFPVYRARGQEWKMAADASNGVPDFDAQRLPQADSYKFAGYWQRMIEREARYGKVAIEVLDHGQPMSISDLTPLEGPTATAIGIGQDYRFVLNHRKGGTGLALQSDRLRFYPLRSWFGGFPYKVVPKSTPFPSDRENEKFYLTESDESANYCEFLFLNIETGADSILQACDLSVGEALDHDKLDHIAGTLIETEAQYELLAARVIFTSKH